MDGIYNANNEFPFSKLSLLKPTSVQGGNYFIKFRINELPLYIQTPKCNTKQGILKAGKKYFSDLLFTNEDEPFIQWIEKLENYSQKYIYDNRETWFDTELDLHDIENSFSSCVKLYKSGKYYLVRTYVPTQLGKCVLKIYDETEEIISPEEINDTTNIITILEFQGIKCSARSFQIEIEIKQMLVLPTSNLFEKCILAKGKSSLPKIPEEHFLSSIVSDTLISNENKEEDLGKYGSTDEKVHAPSESKDTLLECDTQEPIEHEEPDDLLKEIELSLEEIPEDEEIKIKTRNDVYYQMYQDAKKKAKLAKDLALSAYLEAKHIKNTYMLEDIDDSESDLDDELFSENQS